MNRKKHFLLILVALVLSIVMAFTLFACNRNTGDSEEGKVDEKALIANGSFSGVDSETYPKSPSSWTASAGSSSGAQATPSVQGQDILTGVINVSSGIYDSNYKKWKLSKTNPAKPSSQVKDNNILMINNLVDSAYRYSSSNINIEKNSYYKITIRVKTDATARAFMYVLGDAYAAFEDRNTNNAWTDFTLYVEGATNANKTISIAVANGWGDKVNGTMSKGVVFYDNITVEKLENKDDKDFGKKEYEKQVSLDTAADNNIATYSMKQSDTEFEYTTGSQAPFSPSKYNGSAGYTEGSDNAPYSSSYTTFGVLDQSKETSLAKLGLVDVTKCPGSLGSKMLFINNTQRTAYGYRSRVPFVIEAGKKYVVSMMIRTQNIVGNGATLRLVESTSDTNRTNQFSKINTNGAWEQFTFTITGNQLSDKEIYFELWLGEGGKIDEANWVKGTVYMDHIVFGELVENEPQPASEAAAFAEGIKTNNKPVDYTDSIDATKNLIENGYIMGDGTNGWDQLGALEGANAKKYDADKYEFFDFNNKIFKKDDVDVKVAQHQVIKNIDAKYLPAAGIMVKTQSNPEGVALTDAIKISLNKPTGYSFIINKGGANDLVIAKNSYYKISMWVRTDLDEKYDSVGLNVKLKQVNKDEDKDDTVIASFDNINTRKQEVNNHYTELTFYVEGSNVDPANVYLEVSLGSGTLYTPATHVEGSAYLTLLNMEKISHEDYTKASTTGNVKKNSLAKSSGASTTVSNGNFSDTDINTTYDNYTKYQGVEKNAEGEDVNKTVKFIGDNGDYIMPTAPTSWSISNKAYLEALNTGIVSNAAQFDSIFNHSSLGSSFEDFMSGKSSSTVVPPAGMKPGSALVISTKEEKTGDKNKGFLTVPTSPDTCGCEQCKKEGKEICDGSHPGANCLHTKSNGILPVGYTSSSISLSASEYYMVSVKVKVGAGTASVVLSNNNASQKVVLDTPSTDWQDVTFYINTGLSATSVKLELYLGDKGSPEPHPGTVAFDNAIYKTIDKEIYEATAESDTVKKVAFLVDSFNIDKHTEEGLTAPNNWSGALGANGKGDEDSLVKGVFDKNYTRNEILKTTDEKGVVTPLNSNVYDFLLGNTIADNNFLVINNVVPNAYSFTNTSTKTLDKGAYYKVSVKVLTYGLKETETAYISLKLKNVTYTFDKYTDDKDATKSIKVNTSTYKDGNEELAKDWTTYTFYVSTPKDADAVDKVTITLGLGKASDNKDKKDENFVQGYAFFDDVEFTAIDAETFNKDATDSATIKKIELTKEDILKKEEDEKKEEGGKADNSLLWLYITSGVIGGLTLIVIVAFVIKKYWPAISKFFSKKSGKSMSDYDKNNPNANKDSKKSNKSKNEFKD